MWVDIRLNTSSVCFWRTGMFCGSGTWTGTGLSGVRVFPRCCASARGLDDMEATVRGRSGGDVGWFTWTRLWT